MARQQIVLRLAIFRKSDAQSAECVLIDTWQVTTRQQEHCCGKPADLCNNLWRWRAKEVSDELQLIDNIPAREQGLAKQDLCKDAANAPDIDGWGVLGEERATQLRCSIPPRGHIVCPEDGGWHVIERRSGKAKIADLQLAVRVCKNILGLQIAMKYFGCTYMRQGQLWWLLGLGETKQ